MLSLCLKKGKKPSRVSESVLFCITSLFKLKQNLVSKSSHDPD